MKAKYIKLIAFVFGLFVCILAVALSQSDDLVLSDGTRISRDFASDKDLAKTELVMNFCIYMKNTIGTFHKVPFGELPLIPDDCVNVCRALSIVADEGDPDNCDHFKRFGTTSWQVMPQLSSDERE